MEILTEHALQSKLQQLRALTDAIHRTREVLSKEKTVACAIQLQDLLNQRRELQALIPKPRLVVDNSKRESD